jgi:hypothetical protein
VAHSFLQLVDVVHQYQHLCGNCCHRFHGCKGTANK